MYPIYPAWVLDATTLLPNTALKGQQVQVVTRNTTTPYPIFDAASDPIPSSLVTVTQAATTPTVYIDTATPEAVYLDWYDAGSGARGPIWFEEVSRQSAVGAHAAAAASATSASASSAAATATAADVGALREWVERGITSRNVILDPRATVAANWSAVNATATETMVTGATDGPTLPDGSKATTYARYTMTANTGSVASSFGYSMPNENAGLWPVGTPVPTALYIRSSVALPAVAPNMQQQAPATPWTETGVNGSNQAIPANTWTRIGGVFTSTVEAGSFGARAFLQTSSSVLLVTGAVVEVTLALATPGLTVLPDHFDGDSPDTAYVGNVWSGTPNASVSEHIEMKFVRSVNGIGPDSSGNVSVPTGGGGGVSAHGSLSGLAADDHLQYFNTARGDARYYTKEAASALVAAANAASSIDDRKRENHSGEQAISTITDLESRLQAASASGGSPIVILPDDGLPPVGVAAGSIIARIPTGTVPTTAVETVAYTSQGTTVTCPVPTERAIGDVMIFIPAFDGAATDIACSDTGWTEVLDYSGSQNRKSAVYVYRITDSAALAALGSNVTASVGSIGRRMGICFKLSGVRAASAWPAYSSGSNRSAATLQSATTTGWTIQGFATTTVPFSKVVAITIHDTEPAAATVSGFTEIAHVSASDAGSEPKTLTVLIKDLAAGPIPAATVVHPVTSTNAAAGGQFIIPAAP